MSDTPVPSLEQMQPCQVAVIAALAMELGHLQDRLKDVAFTQADGFRVSAGTLEGRRVVLVQSGPGRQKAARATEALLDAHRPQLVISAGFAGGLIDELKRNDLLIADHLLAPESDPLALAVPEQLQSLPNLPVRLGAVLTVDRIIREPEEKARLGQQHQALAVEMESYAVAQVALRREVPLLCARVISDTVTDRLPKDLERLIEQSTLASRVGAALGAVVRRPSSIKDFYHLSENALLAAERLADLLTTVILRSFPAEPAED